MRLCMLKAWPLTSPSSLGRTWTLELPSYQVQDYRHAPVGAAQWCVPLTLPSSDSMCFTPEIGVWQTAMQQKRVHIFCTKGLSPVLRLCVCCTRSLHRLLQFGEFWIVVKSEVYKGLEIIFAIVAFPLAFPELPGAVQAEAYQIPSLRTRLQVFSLYFLSTHSEEIEKTCLKMQGPEPCILSRGVLAPPSSTHTTHACMCINT